MRHVFTKLAWKQPAHAGESLQKFLRAKKRAMARDEPCVLFRRHKIVIAGNDDVLSLGANFKAVMCESAV